MRLLVEDIVAELRLCLQETKSLRGRVLLKQALKALQEFKKSSENQP